VRTTILILSVDEAPLLEHSLPAAAAQGAEVVVVDNAGGDATLDVALSYTILATGEVRNDTLSRSAS